MSVIVTNAGNRIAYNVVRSLGSKGLKVYAGDFARRSMSFVSRYAAGSFLYPSPFRDPDGFVAALLEQIERVNADVLIPVFEETFLIAKHKQLFSGKVAMVVPDYDQILIAHNKDKWEGLARRLGIAVPATYSPDELRAGTRPDVRFPVLIKPKQGGGAWGIQEVPSVERLQELLAQPTWTDRSWDRFFVQEKIIGQTHCVAMLFNRGALRATVGYRQVRDYPPTGGQATRRVSIRHERSEEEFERLLRELRWHGPCQADFIIDQVSGVPYLIDVNPRLWGSLVQAIACGVDFPALIHAIATHGDVPPVTSYPTGVVTTWIGGELASLFSKANPRSTSARLRDLLSGIRSAEAFDDFSLTDPLPFLTWSVDVLRRAAKVRSLGAVSRDSLDGIWE
jgi:predicted ATP-grasp superfamily ATP-dependent carboligase